MLGTCSSSAGPPLLEKCTQQAARLLGERPFLGRKAVIEPRIAAELVQRHGSTGLRITRREHESSDARLNQRSHAHHAGLERHVERAADSMITRATRGLPERDDLRMRRRIAIEDRTVASTRYRDP